MLVTFLGISRYIRINRASLYVLSSPHLSYSYVVHTHYECGLARKTMNKSEQAHAWFKETPCIGMDHPLNCEFWNGNLTGIYKSHHFYSFLSNNMTMSQTSLGQQHQSKSWKGCPFSTSSLGCPAKPLMRQSYQASPTIRWRANQVNKNFIRDVLTTKGMKDWQCVCVCSKCLMRKQCLSNHKRLIKLSKDWYNQLKKFVKGLTLTKGRSCFWVFLPSNLPRNIGSTLG